ncbi:hypothetical protein [Planobispora takensis]|uniref:Uncharacterized protein n=1 Tax=Planobispora takensis TaxID=1367882 RepID=A0A8J3WWA6_9ACTN|nr:hypothetical protein [Planobispora takensis]GII03593.1 hypothetical protein Pta02_56010 [Planobispora takensis]
MATQDTVTQPIAAIRRVLRQVPGAAALNLRALIDPGLTRVHSAWVLVGA